MGGELTALKHEIQLLRERLEQQSQQTRAAVAHARLLQDQLAAETTARVEAQVINRRIDYQKANITPTLVYARFITTRSWLIY